MITLKSLLGLQEICFSQEVRKSFLLALGTFRGDSSVQEIDFSCAKMALVHR